MATAAAPTLSIAQQYKFLRTWIGLDVAFKSLADAYGKRLPLVLASEEIDLAQERGWLCRPPEPVPTIVDDYLLQVLGCPWGKDTTGGYYTPETDFWLDYCPVPAVLYNHGQDDTDTAVGQRGAVIGQTLSRDARADGIWYQIALDRSNVWAVRAWEAAKSGRCRVSTGSLRGVSGETLDGWLSDWPVLEISLFHSAGKERRPRHPYAVAVPASVMLPDTQPGEVPEAVMWAIDRSLRCDPVLAEMAAGIQQFMLKGA